MFGTKSVYCKYMQKFSTLHTSLLAVAFLGIATAGYYSLTNNQKAAQEVVPVVTQPVVQEKANVKNASFTIDNEVFVLVNGTAVKESAPGSASKTTVSIFGEPVYGDLNNDGAEDAAVMLVKTGEGSGTFYYAVLAFANGPSYTTTNTLILGDRIAPQTIEIKDGRAVYNYAVRKESEAMTVSPSIGKSLYIHYDMKMGTIGELVKDFEGEADPKRMTLSMKKWSWVKTTMNDGKVTTPKKSDVFSITFNKDGNVAVTTDCNGMGGAYTVNGNKLTFKQMISTMMYCEGSQEQEFASKLQEVASYLFTSKGELILEIKMDSGTMTFK